MHFWFGCTFQAHVRGHQVRKRYRNIVWSVGIVEKVILRWRRKGSGLRGFRSESPMESSSIQCQPAKEDDYDFLQEGRKQTEVRMQRALSRVKSMVQYPEAREQYQRLLTVVTEFQESKVARPLTLFFCILHADWYSIHEVDYIFWNPIEILPSRPYFGRVYFDARKFCSFFLFYILL